MWVSVRSAAAAKAAVVGMPGAKAATAVGICQAAAAMA